MWQFVPVNLISPQSLKNKEGFIDFYELLKSTCAQHKWCRFISDFHQHLSNIESAIFNYFGSKMKQTKITDFTNV